MSAFDAMTSGGNMEPGVAAGAEEDLDALPELPPEVAQAMGVGSTARAARMKYRKAYMLQALSNKMGAVPGANVGAWYVDGPANEPDKDGKITYQDGYAVPALVVKPITFYPSRAFNREQKQICWSGDSVKGYPTQLGMSAPYNIQKGQACISCPWANVNNAPEGGKAGACSRQLHVVSETVIPKGQPGAGETIRVESLFQNTGYPAGTAIVNALRNSVDPDTKERQPLEVTLSHESVPNQKHKKPVASIVLNGVKQ